MAQEKIRVNLRKIRNIELDLGERNKLFRKFLSDIVMSNNMPAL